MDLYKSANEQWIAEMQSDDPALVKHAQDALNDFIRVYLREDSFLDRIIPPVPISDGELDRQIWTPKPFKIFDKEPNSPAAISVPFGTLPVNVWIKENRMGMGFDRLETPRFTKDIDELRTNRGIDIRQVLSDSAVKDLSVQKDGKFIQAIMSYLDPAGSNTAGQTLTETGKAQWVSIGGPITRTSLAEGTKIMGTLPSRLSPAIALCNQTTAREFMKWDRNELGGDWAEEVAKKGWAEEQFFGMRWVITIKDDLVPDGTIYFFAAADYLGKNCELQPVTMYIRREAFLLEFFAYGTYGAIVGNVAGVVRVDYSI